ncbi:MAG: hypothetical protein JOZ04_10695 [Acidimicrobiia bacterium]|nr:hypothetical protein [Acidimicrobiia bacterium]
MRVPPFGAGAAAVLALACVACGAPRPAPAAGPVGFSHSPAGAAAAATDYLVTTAEHLMDMDPASRADAIARMTTPAGDAALLALLGHAFEAIDAARLRAGDGPLFARALPVAYSVDSYSAGAADVRVWVCGVVVVTGVVGPTESWTTTHVRVRWQSGDWRLDAFDTVEGPTPATDVAEPTTPTETLATLAPFKAYRYVPA